MKNRQKEVPSGKRYFGPISLYPLSLDDALRAALQTPPPEKSAPVRLRASAVPKKEAQPKSG
jgi:hypothetical protein